MRKTIVVLLCLCTCTGVYGRNRNEAKAAISIDLPPAIMDRNMLIGFSHSFSGKWSAEGGVSLQLPPLIHKNPEEEEHDMNLSEGDGGGELITENLRPEFRMGFRFWPEGYFSGAYISMYCSHSMKTGTDMILGCGYAFRIWRCLGITAGYELKVLDGITGGNFSTKGIRIGINYIF